MRVMGSTSYLACGHSLAPFASHGALLTRMRHMHMMSAVHERVGASGHDGTCEETIRRCLRSVRVRRLLEVI